MAPLIVHPVLVNAVVLATPTSPLVVDLVQVTAGPPRMVKLDTKRSTAPRPTRAGLAGNVVSATTEVEPIIPVPTGMNPPASAARRTGAYRFATCPFDFFMIAPSWGTVEPVNLPGWQAG